MMHRAFIMQIGSLNSSAAYTSNDAKPAINI